MSSHFKLLPGLLVLVGGAQNCEFVDLRGEGKGADHPGAGVLRCLNNLIDRIIQCAIIISPQFNSQNGMLSPQKLLSSDSRRPDLFYTLLFPMSNLIFQKNRIIFSKALCVKRSIHLGLRQLSPNTAMAISTDKKNWRDRDELSCAWNDGLNAYPLQFLLLD